MKKRFLSLSVITALALIIFAGIRHTENRKQKESEYKPTDWLLAQHVYPYGEVDPVAYEESRQQMLQLQDELTSLKSSHGEVWEFAGPMNVGGRVTDIEMHPTDPNTIFACAATGGIYKSTDQGKQWAQIFDGYATLSIGDMDIARSDKRILYVGTGEPNGGNGSVTYDGYGVYKSTDEGISFTHVGLENAGGIGRVIIHPDNPDIVYVAAMGNLFANNPERGVYRTRDGGISWQNILYISDSTGAIDLIIHPTHPDTIYATMWERVRYATHRSYGGPTSGIYRSYNGGDTWDQLTNGLPSGNISRIGLGLCESQPNIIYAHYSDSDREWIDLFKTLDGGDTWFATNSDLEGAYWEGKVHVDPTNPDIVWSTGVSMWYSSDGAESWKKINDLWADQHAIHVYHQDNQFVLIGNDGGVYLSTNGSQTNTKVMTLPITQFYTCEVNYQNPDDIMGGTQDRGTQRSASGHPMEWESILGGDGFIVKVDPTNPDYVYAAYQRGGFQRSTNGGSSFRSAKPASGDRYNWKTPYALDPNDPKTLFLGSHRVYMSTNRALTWKLISDDLTNGDQPPWNYGTISTIAVSRVNSNTLIAGTDDGNVWINPDVTLPDNWIKVSDNLPVRWVTCVEMDPFDAETAYVTFSGLRYHDAVPHIFKTTDLGQSWTDISGNLPDFPVNNIKIDPELVNTYYIATDGGVFITTDGGAEWALMAQGMPFSPVLDLNLHNPTRTLLAATFGRSMWRINLAAGTGVQHQILTEQALSVYPNPASEEINIRLDLSSDQQGIVQIFDLNGRLIETLLEGRLTAGVTQLQWDGQANGQRKPGVYLCRWQAGNSTEVLRMIVR